MYLPWKNKHKKASPLAPGEGLDGEREVPFINFPPFLEFQVKESLLSKCVLAAPVIAESQVFITSRQLVRMLRKHKVLK